MPRLRIPASPDRLAHRRKVALLGLLWVGGGLICVALAWNAMFSPEDVDSMKPLPGAFETIYAEKEDAFGAVQAYILQYLDLETVQDLAWPEPAHSGRRGRHRFDGLLYIQYDDGETQRLVYEVTVQRADDRTWVLERIAFRD